MTRVDSKTIKWHIDGKISKDKYDGSFKFIACFSGRNRLGKTSTLKYIKPAINMAISGTAPCFGDEDYYEEL